LVAWAVKQGLVEPAAMRLHFRSWGQTFWQLNGVPARHAQWVKCAAPRNLKSNLNFDTFV